MDDELLTIARFTTEGEAELLRGLLQASGIDSIVLGAQFATTQGFATLGRPDVEVQVRASQAAAAARLVVEHHAATRKAARAPAAGDTCLACDAPLAAKATKCAACGWTWLDEPAA